MRDDRVIQARGKDFPALIISSQAFPILSIHSAFTCSIAFYASAGSEFHLSMFLTTKNVTLYAEQ